MISKHIDFIAIGALLFGMAVYARSQRVLLALPAPVRIRIAVPRPPAPVVVAPHIPRIVVNL